MRNLLRADLYMKSIPASINCNGILIELDSPKIMAIINLSENSFYKHSIANSEKSLFTAVEGALEQGAHIIDIGAMSSKPGSELLSHQDEQRQLIWALNLLRKQFSDVVISVDTPRASTAQVCLDLGVHMINDIYGASLEPEIIDVLASYSVPYVLMHMQGMPADMQQNPSYDDVILEICDFFIHKIEIFRSRGVVDIILDPGFGFGKTLDQNFEILKYLESFQFFDCPILVGVSRKSMIYKLLDSNPEEALNGTTACHVYALERGANILRVHDVKAAREAITIFEKIKGI